MQRIGDILSQVANTGYSEIVEEPSQELIAEASSWGLSYLPSHKRFQKHEPGMRTYDVEITATYSKTIRVRATSYAEARMAVDASEEGMEKKSMTITAREVIP